MTDNDGARVVTLTANPSLDRTLDLPGPLVAGGIVRLTGGATEPGGKGVNVARAIAAAGGDVVSVLPAELAAVGEHDHPLRSAGHGALGRRLRLVGGAEAVGRADPVGAEEHDVQAESVEGADRGVADRGLGDPADPAAEQVQGDPGDARQPGGDGDGVGRHVEPAVGREQLGEGRGGRAAVEDQAPAVGVGQQVQSRGRDLPLRLAAGSPSLAHAGLDQAECCPAGDGTAVHATQEAGALEDGEVPADGLRGDAEALGDGGDRHPAALGDQSGDRLLTLFRVHADLPPMSVHVGL